MTEDVQNTLNERKNTHGDFAAQAATAQAFKTNMANIAKANRVPLAPDQCEALDMIATKISRILHGDPNHVDSWHDIAGYATLVVNRLEHGKSHLGS